MVHVGWEASSEPVNELRQTFRYEGVTADFTDRPAA
jgi:hypothetical protein